MGLTPEQDVVLSLLPVVADPQRRSAERLGERVARADPGRLLALLVRTRVEVTLGMAVLDEPSAELPDWFGKHVMAARSLARRHGLLQHTLVQRVTAALNREGIPVVTLKGTGLADSVHGELGARQSTDIDLLVSAGAMDRAVEVVRGLGWEESELGPPPGELPRLHRVLVHPTHPPVEVHWRVHWYESSFSEEAIGRAIPGEAGGSVLQPADELAFLLLFFARDGLAGLRLAVDLAAWWALAGEGSGVGGEIAAVARAHPSLAPALSAAAQWTERLAGLEPGSLLDPPPALSRAQRLAVRLANPWLDGSRQQIDAEVSLIDGLLAPRGAGGAFLRRNLAQPAHETLTRNPRLIGASRARVAHASGMHALRVLARYGLATRRLVTGPRGGETPAKRNARS